MADRFPWFPFYAADWRLSRTVREMTPEQRGGYVELLCVAWHDGIQEPSLKDDDNYLAKMSELGEKRWKKAGAAIRACFEVRDGRLYNERLSKVWEIQRAKYQIAEMAGKESARQRALKRESNDRTNGRLTGVGRVFQQKRNHTDADTDRTKSSSAPTPMGALTDGAIAAAKAGAR